MKFIKTLAIALLMTVSSTFAAWEFDISHTNVQFEVSHMVITSTTGKFKMFEGKIEGGGEDLSGATIEFVVDVSSIDTDNKKRDDHLRSPDFFDAKKYPKMTFKSTSFKKVSDKKYKLIGNLTIKNVTKKIELDVTFNGKIKDPWGNTRMGFKLSGELERFDYGLEWSKTMDAGGLVVGNTVEIVANIELIEKK